MAYYEFCHNLGIHSWDIPALVVLAIMVIVGVVHSRNQKKRDEKFEEELKKETDEIKGASQTTQV